MRLDALNCESLLGVLSLFLRSRILFFFSPGKSSKREATQVGAGGRCDMQAGGRGEGPT